MKIIDPHLHLFDLTLGDYHWLLGEHPPNWPNLDVIRQDHYYNDLRSAAEPFELVGLVHIEAGFDNQNPINELKWLACQMPNFHYRAISYIAIDTPNNTFHQALSDLNHPSLIGIRDITEGHDGIRLTHDNVVANLTLLAKNNLIFEAQAHCGHQQYRKAIIQLAKQIPDLQIVITHFGLLSSKDDCQKALAELANEPNIAIKYSGQEMCHNAIGDKQAFDLLVNTFGETRIMLASNFPVCLQKIQYHSLWQQYEANWPNPSTFKDVCYLNAKRIYQLDSAYDRI
ncbi:hypothetical protein PALB_19630 [Pseudoalteromonas luteoviolacea B = ATCC 29581]|nr:hypothetical protein PALB_19630 [Pseudoalteromonas luteoviolacea B = ATCC 29581]